MGPRARSRPFLLAVLATAIGTAACEPDPADLRIAPQARPFYWYFDEKIILTVDPASITVETDSAVLATLRTSLLSVGVSVDSSTDVGVNGHWALWLSPGSGIAKAVAAADRARMHAGVRFASNTFTLSTPCPIRVINRAIVKYLPSTTPEQINALQQRAGLTVDSTFPDFGPPYRTLRFPVRSPYTPLEITAAIDRHPWVEFADADMLSCFRAQAGLLGRD